MKLAIAFLVVLSILSVGHTNTYVYVVNSSSIVSEGVSTPVEGSVSVIESASNTVIATISDLYSPKAIASSSNGMQMYMIASGLVSKGSVGSVPLTLFYIIDTLTNTVTSVTPFNLGIGLQANSVPIYSSLAITPDGTRAYITHPAGISVIDLSINALIQTINVGTDPWGIAITPDGSRAYVANNGSSDISVLDTVTNTVLQTIYTGAAPSYIAINPSGSLAYAINPGEGNYSVIDLATDAILQTVNVGANPGIPAFTPDGSIFYVPNQNDNTISEINPLNNELIRLIDGGAGPSAVAVNPDGKTAYVTNFYDNNISILNISSGTISGTINVGSSPVDVTTTPICKYGVFQARRH